MCSDGVKFKELPSLITAHYRPRVKVPATAVDDPPVSIFKKGNENDDFGANMSEDIPIEEEKKQLPVLVTHDGASHADDMLSYFLLRQLDEYKENILIRTRDEGIIKSADVVFDVGGEYDPEILRFDHHQGSYHEVFSEATKDVTMAAFGLLYKHFGKRILKQWFPSKLHDDEKLDFIHSYIYLKWVREIDAIDNGIAVCDGDLKYTLQTTLSQRLHVKEDLLKDQMRAEREEQFKQDKEDGKIPKEQEFKFSLTDEEYIDIFKQFSDYAGTEFKDFATHSLEMLKLLKITKKAFEKRYEVHSSGKIMDMNYKGYCDKDILVILEDNAIADAKKDGKPIPARVLYFLYGRDEAHTRVRAVGVRNHPFRCRAPFPEAWRAKTSDKEYEHAIGVKGVTFIHKTGFLAATVDHESGMALAIKALNDAEDDSHPFLTVVLPFIVLAAVLLLISFKYQQAFKKKVGFRGFFGDQ
ncbi:Metal-dependent protein hydrolase like protein [Aduncisulcus paluster]|uniref:Metal-dependent protein hydrolase like protein n=1 Tax=Aduncisulcus paluster TaxID=2918883 RepID=A0ABQ5KPF9_9EUKA|nr:Metal-dependent protein hydrolase like protein [Aduncisulcus paluster]